MMTRQMGAERRDERRRGVRSLSVVVGAGQSPGAVADAAMDGDRAAVETLLKGGGDVNAAQGDGTTALHWAAIEERRGARELLLPRAPTSRRRRASARQRRWHSPPRTAVTRWSKRLSRPAPT